MLVVKIKLGLYGDITIQEHKRLFLSWIHQIGKGLMKQESSWGELLVTEK